MIAGRISEQNFNTMLEKTQTEQTELKTKVSEGRKRLSDKQGFLTFLPIWIVSYWFNTFFSQLVCRVKKDGSRQWAIKKRARHILSDISTVLSVVLLCFWIYVYVSQYTELLNFK